MFESIRILRCSYFVPKKPAALGRIGVDLTFTAFFLTRMALVSRQDAMVVFAPPVLGGGGRLLVLGARCPPDLRYPGSTGRSCPGPQIRRCQTPEWRVGGR